MTNTDTQAVDVREAIARIIDPNAWNDGMFAEPGGRGQMFDQCAALRKADAILTSLQPAETARGEERARELLAVAFEENGQNASAEAVRKAEHPSPFFMPAAVALRAILAALSPPLDREAIRREDGRRALRLQEQAELAQSNCAICEGEDDWSHCPSCSLNFGRAIDARNAVFAGLVTGAWCPTCGKESPDGLDCLTCARWWAANNPDREAIRAEAFEEAAKVAEYHQQLAQDNLDQGYRQAHNAGYREASRRIASAIRALSPDTAPLAVEKLVQLGPEDL